MSGRRPAHQCRSRSARGRRDRRRSPASAADEHRARPSAARTACCRGASAATASNSYELRWLPEPLVSAHGSVLRTTTRVQLDVTARLVLRESSRYSAATPKPPAASSAASPCTAPDALRSTSSSHTGRRPRRLGRRGGPRLPPGCPPTPFRGDCVRREVPRRTPAGGDRRPHPARRTGRAGHGRAPGARLLRGVLDEALDELLDAPVE